MKLFYLITTLLCVFMTPRYVAAQITIDAVKADPSETILKNRVRSTAVDPESYFSRARYRAQRAAIRKGRNKLEFGGGMLATVSSYSDSWIETSGGDNSIGLTASLFLRHTFTKSRFTIETKFDAKFGYNRMNVESQDAGGATTSAATWFKNQDEFQISTAPAYILSKSWSLASIIKFRSQIASGYISRSQQETTHRKSTFMSPGYLDVSGGFTYTCPQPRFPIKINLSPLALSAVFVENAQVRQNVWDKKPGWQAYGLANENKTSKYEGGSSVQIDFDRTFGKKGIFRYRTTLFSFIGWLSNIGMKQKYSDFHRYKEAFQDWTNAGATGDKPMLSIHPTVRWENTLDIKATKYLSTTFNFQLYYNRAQNYDIQTQLLLSVGLTYTFKNK